MFFAWLRSLRKKLLPFSRNSAKRRKHRLKVEVLEDRTVPDGSLGNAALSAAQSQLFRDGLRGLADWTGSLAHFSYLDQPVALVNQKIGPATALDGAIRQGLRDPVDAYFANDFTPATDEVVDVLRGLSGTIGDMTVTVDPESVNGGLTEQGNEVRFSLAFRAARATEAPIDLGGNASTVGLTTGPAARVGLNADLYFECTFGLDLTPGLAPSQAFFIRPATLSAGVTVNASDLNFGVHVGFLEAAVVHGAVSLAGSVDVRFNNPDRDPRGNITLSELQGTTLGQLVTLTPGGSLTASLPVHASLGSFTTTGAPTVTVTDADVFGGAPPAVSVNADFQELLDFRHVTPHNVLGLLDQFAAWAGEFRGASVFASGIPFAEGRTLGDLFDLGAVVNNRLIRPLGSESPGEPSFASAQELADRLATIFGLDASDVAANFDPATRNLTYHVRFSDDLPAVSAPVRFGFDLGALAGLSSSATVSLGASAGFEFTFGINLTPVAEGQTLADKFFIQDASVNGTATLTATDINASGRFGFLGIETRGGTAGGTVNLSLGLKDPATGTPGGRVRLRELFDALVSVGTVVTPPTLPGSAGVVLPQVRATGNFLGILPGNPTITISLPDVASSASVNDDFAPRLDFRGLGAGRVVEAFDGVNDFLANLSRSSIVSLRLPGINRSIGGLFNLPNLVGEVVRRFENRLPQVAQDLAPRLEEALQSLPGSPAVRVTFTPDRVLRVELRFRRGLSDTLPLDLDLRAFGVDVPNLVNVGTDGRLSVQADATLDLHLGIDLSDPTSPTPVVFDTTRLTLNGRVNGTNLNFSAGVGPLGLFVRNGSVTVDRDGNPATDDPATVVVSLAPGPDGRYLLSQLSRDIAGVNLDGVADLALPLFFPTETTPLGGPGNNNLRLIVGNLADIPGTTQVVTPDFANAFAAVNLVDNLGLVIDGLDRLLAVVQDGLGSRVFRGLPLVGANLRDTARFIQDFRTDTVAHLRALFAGAADRTAPLVQRALFEALGPGPGPGPRLGLLRDLNDDGRVTIDDIQVVVSADQVQFNLRLGKSYEIGARSASTSACRDSACRSTATCAPGWAGTSASASGWTGPSASTSTPRPRANSP